MRTNSSITGIFIPLFSLKKENDSGIGEYSDLKLLINFAKKTGIGLIQILPVNDTGDDPSPYAPISAFALHPIYIHVDNCSFGSEKVDYAFILEKKLSLLKRLFEQEPLLESVEFKDFFEKNKQWLVPYASFCALKKGHQAEFYYFLQFKAHTQFLEASLYAQSQGVILKGDLQVGVSLESVDYAQHTELFSKERRIGAPPDFFDTKGQNWGFPSYNWGAMDKDGYAWMKRRVLHLSNYFQALRIDHVLGFFRLWEIPEEHKDGRLGFYKPSIGIKGEEPSSFILKDYEGILHPRIDLLWSDGFKLLSKEKQEHFSAIYQDYFYSEKSKKFWAEEGRRKLKAIQSASSMLLCVEDFGPSFEEIRDVLSDLNLLTLEIFNHPKKEGEIFRDFNTYPKNSVAITSNHDIDPLRLWWKKEKNKELFSRSYLNLEGDIPDDLTGEMAERILTLHLQSPAKIVIIAFQDLMAIDEGLRAKDPEGERVNIPGNLEGVWSYRMHISMEKLLMQEAFIEKVKRLNSRSI